MIMPVGYDMDDGGDDGGDDDDNDGDGDGVCGCVVSPVLSSHRLALFGKPSYSRPPTRHLCLRGVADIQYVPSHLP